MKKLPYLICMIFLFSTSPKNARATGDSPAAPPDTLPELIAQAYENSPSIRAAREQWRAAVEKYRLATAYPDPQLMITYFPEPIETRLGPQDWNASLSQMIPFPGKLGKVGEIARADIRMAKVNMDMAVREVTLSIRESYHELLYIQQAREIAEKNAGLLEELRKIGESAYAQDRTAFTDMVKAQAQTGQIRYDILLLEELEQTEKTRLNGLLNRPPDSPLGKISPIPVLPIVYKIEELYRLAEANQDEIRMAGVRVEKTEAMMNMAAYQNLPDFRLGLFYAGIGDPDDASAMPSPDAGDDAVGIQFGFNIPLWFGKNSSQRAQARAESEKAKAMKEGQINMARTRVHSLWFKLQNAKRLITLYREEMLPQSMQAVHTAETWFREGQGSFSDFAETQAAAYNFQLSLARASADYGKILAKLERICGQSLTVKEVMSDG